MTVLQLDFGKQMRGGQWQVLRLMRGLRSAGHSPILMARRDAPLYGRAKAEGFDVRRVSDGGIFSVSARCGLVHAHDARSHSWGAVFARAPLVVSRRVAFPPKRGWLSRWKYRRAARFIAVSRCVAGMLAESGIPESKISVVYDGVPTLHPARPVDSVVIPESGDPLKGMKIAIEGAVMANVPYRLSRDLERDLSGALAMIYITQTEGLGSGALLAMSAGVPVIASAVGGLMEVITDGENGILVENSARAIAAAVRRLLETPALADSIRAKARETIETRFTEEIMVASTLRVYQQVLGA